MAGTLHCTEAAVASCCAMPLPPRSLLQVNNASKGGVVLLTRNVAMDYARLGIRCNAICPGFIDTPLFRRTTGHDFMRDYVSSIRAETKMQRFGQPEEIAAVAFFLAGGDSSFMTGQAMIVDGGATARLSTE